MKMSSGCSNHPLPTSPLLLLRPLTVSTRQTPVLPYNPGCRPCSLLPAPADPPHSLPPQATPRLPLPICLPSLRRRKICAKRPNRASVRRMRSSRSCLPSSSPRPMRWWPWSARPDPSSRNESKYWNRGRQRREAGWRHWKAEWRE